MDHIYLFAIKKKKEVEKRETENPLNGQKSTKSINGITELHVVIRENNQKTSTYCEQFEKTMIHILRKPNNQSIMYLLIIIDLWNI